MPTEPNSTPAHDLALAIAQAAEAGHLSKGERMAMHRKAIQAIAFRHGLEGVNTYKAEYPETKSIRLRGGALAYVQKPEGYGATLLTIALHWLDSPSALAATNAADVARLNEKLGTNYPPAKHFSEALSKSRLAKIKAAYAQRGVPLGPNVKTMAHVRKAARAAQRLSIAEERFSSVGAISGNTLVANGRSYPIEMNGQRRCIRPTINGKRRRLYLDELEWIADWFGVLTHDPLEDTNTISIMGDLSYLAPVADIGSPAPSQISDLPYRPSKLDQWLDANRLPTAKPTVILEGDDVDPLEFIDV